MRVLFYGRLAEAIAPELEVHAALGSSIAELRDKLVDAHPEAEHILSRRARACVRGALVDDDYQVDPAEAVEFLPPVSGG